jgi:stage V sporulation protein SpoVS
MRITPLATDIRNSTDYKVYHNGVEAKYTSDATATVAEIVTGLTAAIDPTAWASTTAYVIGDHVTNDTAPVKIYICTAAGTSAGSGGPTGTGSGITDGTVTWNYVGPKSAITATDNTTYVGVAADTLADAFTLYPWDFTLLGMTDVTADGSPGIAADIAAVRVENDDWYCLIPTNQGKAVITAAAAYIETTQKTMIAASPDSDIYDSTSTTDIAAALQTAAYDRTMLIYHYKANLQRAAGRWAGYGLPQDPGTITWAYKTLAGLDYMTLTDNQITAINNKDCNYYVRIAGVNHTQTGVVPSNEWYDVIRGTDFMAARVQEGVFGQLVNQKKIPFTDVGVGVVESEVRAVMELAVKRTILAPTPAYTVTVPAVADVSAGDKAARLLPDVKAEGTLAGAIHKTQVEITVSL